MLLNPFRKEIPLKTRNYFGWTVFAFSGALISLSIGLGVLSYIKDSIDERSRSELLSKVQTIALLVDSEDISKLKGNESDLDTSEYKRVKNTLYNLHNTNSGARFVYYMRGNSTNTKLIFLADSESPDSVDYSPPGQVYEDTSELEMINYINGVPFVEGPYFDEWGEWVSAYSPIWHEGKEVAIIGMDVDASKWSRDMRTIQSIILSAMLIVILWFILLGLYINKTLRCMESTQS